MKATIGMQVLYHTKPSDRVNKRVGDPEQGDRAAHVTEQVVHAGTVAFVFPDGRVNLALVDSLGVPYQAHHVEFNPPATPEYGWCAAFDPFGSRGFATITQEVRAPILNEEWMINADQNSIDPALTSMQETHAKAKGAAE